MAGEMDSGKKCLRTRKPRRLVPIAKQESAIVAVAAELFLERGFRGVSIDAITSIVGGSKRDIYALFRDKENLFDRCVSMLVAERAAPLDHVLPTEDIEACLISVGQLIIDIFLQPRTLALHRLMVANGDRTLSASKSFLQGGPQRAYNAVSELLRYYSLSGRYEILDPDACAIIIVSGLTAELQIRALMGESIEQLEREIKASLVIRQFLNGVCASIT
ncbi:TetR/AcrR family transcriptional regulator [Rhizobium panacihumi]|uniref:TetR/AcrR family transcriptional regulator n=1 Tax=Rhizobium panacihumi TaxID=2008450 RepID=UPI003D7BEC65